MKQFFGRAAQTHIETERLSAYLDNQISPAERTQVDQHLQTCASCRAELVSLERTIGILRQLPRVPVPHAFTLSQAQISQQRPTGQAVWWGGLARGATAVAALALVAVVATSLLRSTGLPAAQVAPPRPAAVAKGAPVAAPAEAVEITPAADGQRTIAPAEPDGQHAIAPAADAVALAPAPAPLAAAPLQTSAPEAQPASEEAAAALTDAAQSAPVNISAQVAAAPPTTASATGMGTPGAALAAAAVNPALPAEVRIAYSASGVLWGVDAQDGVRQLAQADGLSTPRLAPDGAWVAYQVPHEGYSELWAIPWAADRPQLMVDERALPDDGLPPGYSARTIADFWWTPAPRVLAVKMNARPEAAKSVPPRGELWHLNTDTQALRAVADLGPVAWVAYAPQGDRFAVLQGIEGDGAAGLLMLYDFDGAHSRQALDFTAAEGWSSDEPQLQWLPAGDALLVAIPRGAGDAALTALYRVGTAGAVEMLGAVAPGRLNWSPDGSHLALIQAQPDAAGQATLSLAAMNGADARPFATVAADASLVWAPDSQHFLYQSAGQTYRGDVTGAITPANSLITTTGPQWANATQFFGWAETAGDRQLWLNDLDGSALNLLALPPTAEYSIQPR